jgi:excinuclease UvrABC nuclease subunit
LEGKYTGLLREMEEEMLGAAERMEFETATVIGTGSVRCRR